MRDEIRASSSCGRRAQSAVIPSRLSTARIATVYSYVRSSPITPTLCTGSSTAKLCHSRTYQPSRRTSADTIASARRSRSSRGGTHQRQLQALEASADLFWFVEPQHAVVHEDARQAIADGAVNEQRGDGRIHAAAERADDAAVPDLPANLRRGLLDERRHRPV